MTLLLNVFTICDEIQLNEVRILIGQILRNTLKETSMADKGRNKWIQGVTHINKVAKPFQMMGNFKSFYQFFGPYFKITFIVNSYKNFSWVLKTYTIYGIFYYSFYLYSANRAFTYFITIWSNRLHSGSS